MTQNIQISRHFTQLVRTHGLVVVRGFEAVRLLQQAISVLTKDGELVLTFDPESDASLRDYLASAAMNGLEGLLVGAAIGALIGIFFECPAQGMAIGMGVGAVAGAATGLNRVRHGWRLRASWIAGQPVVAVRGT